MSFKRNFTLFLVRHFMRLVADVEYRGLENLPATGKVIIATNHLSRLDIPTLAMIPHRPDVIALVRDKYKKYPLFWFVVETTGCIWLDVDKADFTAFRSAVDALNQRGVAMGIAPEGTRSKSGKLLEGKPGTLLLALKANAPIVPVGIHGTEITMQRALRLQRSKITATFGPPYIMPPINRENREEVLQKATDEIMCRIAALLPPEYRGYYAEHPRLKELLAASA